MKQFVGLQSASVLYGVDRLSILDGAIVAVGWCPHDITPQLALNGSVGPQQSCARYRRDDVAAVHGRAFANSGFRCSAVFPSLPGDKDEFGILIGGKLVGRAELPVNNEAERIRVRFCSTVAERQNSSLLEIGSRARSGNTYRHFFPTVARYVGLDVSRGPNVDVVGDAHTMSKSLAGERFDFAFSVSVFEHLIMPWVAAYELNKVMKLGGLAIIQSHPSWPLHETPWDFFRFSKDAWNGLFNPLTGFEILEAGYGIEAAIIPRISKAGPLHKMDESPTYLLSACVARKVGDPKVNWSADPSLVYDLNYSH